MEKNQGVYITPSEVIEYLYCPRFVFFMNCLCIPQHEEQRYKVLKGRELHKRKERINRDYVRKKIGCRDKEILVYMSSEKYHVKGIVDEVLFLEDGTCAPMDYKFAEYRNWVFNTHRVQSAIYGVLIKENYRKEVKRGYICYVRSKNLLKEIVFRDKDFEEAIEIINEILEIIQRGYYPKRTNYLARCIDCCYKNICV
jgi:CRISPR-associated exonuclease Cas4